MMARRSKTVVDLGHAKEQLVSVKTLVISLGLPMSKVRTLDDAIRVIEQLETRSKNV
jgi:hypothetical protein